MPDPIGRPTREAVAITASTLLGVLRTEFPLAHGNCCSVRCADGSGWQIVNFYAENLEELLRLGLTWPVAVRPIDDHRAVVHDPRIPDDWYRERWCECCCPAALLPLPQRLCHERQEARGERVVSAGAVSTDRSRRPTIGAPPPVRPAFTVTEEVGAVVVHAAALAGPVTE